MTRDRARGGREGGTARKGRRRGDVSAEPPRGPLRPPLHLSDAVVAELRATARPGKGDVLVKVFADAAGALADGDYGEAIRLGEQAKHIALRSAAARELLGLAYYRAGRWEEAIRELSTFRRISGSRVLNPLLADSYRARGKPERAVELCDEMDRGEVGSEAFYEGAIVAAGALADLGRLDEAIARLEELELRPAVAEEHHVRAWYALADLLERRGRFHQAREWFEAVAAADPDLSDAPERAGRLGASS